MALLQPECIGMDKCSHRGQRIYKEESVRDETVRLSSKCNWICNSSLLLRGNPFALMIFGEAVTGRANVMVRLLRGPARLVLEWLINDSCLLCCGTKSRH